MIIRRMSHAGYERKKPQISSQSGRSVSLLRQMLLRGEFRAGERISELPLVERLGVSRTPIRLALEKLAQEGLLEPVAGGGFAVRTFMIADIWDAIEARGALEGTAAKLASERLANAGQLETLVAYTAEMGALADVSGGAFVRYSQLNGEFHAAIVDLANSPMVRWALDRFQSIPFAAPSGAILPATSEIVTLAVEQHRAIIEAIRNGEGALAESLAREHARLARRNLEIALEDMNILSRVPGASLIRRPATGIAEDGTESRPILWS
jgi:GntR family transcriptional regulator, vanillate catabolism transcriptional regulator